MLSFKSALFKFIKCTCSLYIFKLKYFPHLINPLSQLQCLKNPHFPLKILSYWAHENVFEKSEFPYGSVVMSPTSIQEDEVPSLPRWEGEGSGHCLSYGVGRSRLGSHVAVAVV